MNLGYLNDITDTQDSKVEFLRSYYHTFHVESKKQVAMM